MSREAFEAWLLRQRDAECVTLREAFEAGQKDAAQRCRELCEDTVHFFAGSKNLHPLHARELETARDLAGAIAREFGLKD